MGKDIKNKVKADARKGLKAKRKKQEEFFKETYSKPKTYRFPPKDKINMNRYFLSPKFIGHADFPKISKAALAVYPVLCSRADFVKNEWFQISQENIGIMAGVSKSTVRKGIEDLVDNSYGVINAKTEEEITLLERQKTSKGRRTFYVYRVGFVRKEMFKKWKGQFFTFHCCIIDSGVWANLPSRAKALYLAMRTVAKFDPEAYALEKDLQFDEKSDVYAYYPEREWDICNFSLSELCRMVSIENTNIEKVIKTLANHRLIEHFHPVWKVYLKPKIK